MSNLQDPRVLFALERTALAWNRSALALMAFGFVIEKSGLLMSVFAPEQYANTAIYHHVLAVFMVGFGGLTNVFSILQYRTGLNSLSEAEFLTGYSTVHPILLNVFTLLMGLLLLLSFYFI